MTLRKPLNQRLRDNFLPTRLQLSAANYYRQLDIESRGRNKAGHTVPVSLQFVDGVFFLCLFGEIIAALRLRAHVEVRGYTYHSLRHHASQSLRDFLRTRLFMNAFYDRKWISLYRAFCDGLAYRSDSFMAPWRDIGFFIRAFSIWRELRNKKQLADLKLRDILVGDLILDSYLRFRPSPVVNIKDWYLLVTIHQAYREINKAFRFFKTFRPKIHLTSYTTYIQHGVASRVALSLGVRVVAFGNYQDLSKTITPDSMGHARNFSLYAQDFEKLDGKAAKLELAGNNIRKRLDGAIDNAIGYMKSSAYAIKTTDVPDVRGAVVMFLHDFYDSNHVYDWMVFEDLWEWICFTVEHCEKAGIPLIVKPHPNQLAGSESDFSKLQKLYPNMRMISPDVTNRQLADAGMACAITVRGSVASEMAYMGIPSISAGNNPHVSFDTFFTPRTPEEYAKLLDNYRELPCNPARMKEQACAFYYMHNLNQTEHEKALRDFAAHWNTFLSYEENLIKTDFDDVREAFEKMRRNPAFRDFIDDLANTLAA
jgi:hypothetical protein